MTQYITACIDGQHYSKAVVELAAWTARRLDTSLKLLHVLDKDRYQADSQLSGTIGLGSREALLKELSELDEKRSRLEIQHSKALLNDLESLVTDTGVPSVVKQQLHGHLVETLLALEPEIRVLVLGKSGELHQQDAKAIGSQLESVVRAFSTHTLIANGDFSEPAEYLLAFDGSETSQKLVKKAIDTPLLKGMTCHLVMVEDADNKRDAFESAAETLSNAGINVTKVCLTGSVGSAILQYQQEKSIGMIVMGAYGHSKLRQFFVGSNTTRLLVDATVPMLLIR
ncbi:universal stress protein [Photobacterium halotolerans]|uniref:Universal stress protein n=1 Tax=Photobacterium halotolerans TaxID=265726 RepID=A0A7X4WE51_9GAMM|nr:universal stress protein [Photobacterium halotolerans]NAW67013.1 universal stress protein [Photobacterium halotolerans]